MHSLNQTVPIPPAFASISGPDYLSTWTSRNDAVVRPLGFVSPYAGSSYPEDFAEMLAHIVVEGPVWYSNWLSQAGTAGTAKLKQKETIVAEYLKNNFNINLYALQKEVQNQMSAVYGIMDPLDMGLAYKLAANSVNNITVDHNASYYTTYGSSAAFNTVYTNYRNSVTAAGRNVVNLVFTFPSAGLMTLVVNYTNPSTQASLQAAYDFNYTVNTTTGVVVFTKKTPEGTTTAHNNGATTTMLPSFTNYLLPYLTGNQFVAAPLPTTITPYDPLYGTYVGFYVNGAPSNYFYGPIVLK
jgi:hypothetical protein